MNEKKLSLAALIEAVLFYKSEPFSKKQLAEIIEVSQEDLEKGLSDLAGMLVGRGLQLVSTPEDVMLGTAAEASHLIEKLQKEDISRDLGKAGSETLAIVLYKGPISRREIDFIRGVNSSFIVRNLLVRGLIDRIEGDNKVRGFFYKPTTELLSYIGISKMEELPEFENVRSEIEKFAATEQNILQEHNAK